MEWGFTSIDGSKFAACNSKDNNFTKNKLDDRIKWLNAHTDEYLRILEDMDKQEEWEENVAALTRKIIEAKLKEAQERLAKYESYQKLMEEHGLSQLSLTDADAKLMKNKDGFAVSYNPQTAVDSETYMIRDFVMTNQVTDHGMLSPTMEGIRKDNPGEILEVTADKGYEKAEGKSCKTERKQAKGHYEKVKVVKFTLKPDREKTSQRLCISEHPFGTIKRAMGATYFLMKGIRNVAGEFALFCLEYNIERAKNLLGFKKMMELMAGA